MTGVLNAMVGQISGLRYTVTVADITVPALIAYGYSSSAGDGAISSSAFLGRTIVDVSSGVNDGTRYGFSIALNYTGVDLPTSFFSAVWVQGTNGVWRTYRTSAVAAYSQNIWAWVPPGGGYDPPWTGSTPSSRAIILVP